MSKHSSFGLACSNGFAGLTTIMSICKLISLPSVVVITVCIAEMKAA